MSIEELESILYSNDFSVDDLKELRGVIDELLKDRQAKYWRRRQKNND